MTSIKAIDATKFTSPILSIKEVVNTQSNLLHNLKKSIYEQPVPLVTSGILEYNFSREVVQYNE